LPVAIVVVVVSCRAVARRRRHRCLRINTGTPLGIPKPKQGSPKRNGDANHKESPNQFGDPRTEMGINTSPYQNGDPRISLGIVQSLTRIGLGFVPIWDFRVSSPNWNGIQNGDPISERGSPYRNGDSPNWFPNRGVPESVWGSFQFGDYIHRE
jgi:hypothetical protein